MKDISIFALKKLKEDNKEEKPYIIFDWKKECGSKYSFFQSNGKQKHKV